MTNFYRWCIACSAALATLTAMNESQAYNVDVMVPAYFFPGLDGNGNGQDDWLDMADAADSIGVTAIMNPANGPGNGPNHADTWQYTQYSAATSNLRNAGGLVIGYLTTDRGARPYADLQTDIQNYVTWYDVDGFFFDEVPDSFVMASKTSAEQEVLFDYYTDLYNYVDTFDDHDYVIGNPGQITDERFLDEPTADALVTLESDYQLLQSVTDPPPAGAIAYTPAPWQLAPDHDPTEFSLIQHNVPTATDMEVVVDAGLAKGFGMFYVTDDSTVDANPFDQLPTYWDAFVDKIEAVNNAGGAVPEPTTMVLAGLALLSTGFYRRR